MIKRDKNNIIVQHSDINLFYADGGDSCARTGPMAAAGSAVDIANLPFFITSTQEIVRHPGQAEYNDAELTSRDNVVQFMVADQDCQRASAFKYAKAGRVNKDWLSPSVRLYLYKIARQPAPLWIWILGNVNMAVDLVWNTKVKPDEEINQYICMCSVLGSFWASHLITMHPNLGQNLKDYWQGWRDQTELQVALLQILKKAIK